MGQARIEREGCKEGGSEGRKAGERGEQGAGHTESQGVGKRSGNS